MFGFSSFSQVPYSTLSGITHEGTASIDGIATLTALGGIEIIGDASITGLASVTALGGVIVDAGNARINGVATIIADASRLRTSSASMSATATVFVVLSGSLITA